MSPMWRSLHVRNYRLFATGAVVSNIGTWMQRVAQDWLVLQITDSGVAVGIATALQFAPSLVFGLWGGVVADRFPKRAILLVTQTCLAITALSLGVLELAGVVQVWHVYVMATAIGVITAFDSPARQSFVVELVGPDDLPNAVSLNSASFNAGRVVGPGLAGVLIAANHNHTGLVFVLNGVSFAAVLFALARLRSDELRPSPIGARGKGALREGLRYVRTRPDLLAVLCTVFWVATFGLNFQLTSALMATRVFHKGAQGYGILGSVMACGSLAGALLAARRERPRMRILLGAAVAFAVLEVTAGLMPTYFWFTVLLVPLGITSLTFMTTSNSLLQLGTHPQMRGRVMALYAMTFFGGAPLGAPTIGWVGENLGARWTLIGGGLLSLAAPLVAGVLLARHQRLRVRPHVLPRPHVTVQHRDVATDRVLDDVEAERVA